MYVLGSGWEVLGVSWGQDWDWALPILEEHRESGICVCFGCGGVGGRFGPGSRRVGWCYVRVCCESGFSVLMARPGICIFC